MMSVNLNREEGLSVVTTVFHYPWRNADGDHKAHVEIKTAGMEVTLLVHEQKYVQLLREALDLLLADMDVQGSPVKSRVFNG
jgi:hypothetical protein